MEFKRILSRFEFVVLIILLVSFFFLVTPEEEKKAAAGTWYVDLNATGNNTGLTAVDAWTSLDNIVWANIVDGDIITIAPGTYSPVNPIVVQSNDVQIKGTNIYARPTIDDSNLTPGQSLIQLSYANSCNNFKLDHIDLDCVFGNASNVVRIEGQYGNEIDTALFYSIRLKNLHETIFHAEFIDNLHIDSCNLKFYDDNSFNNCCMYLENCDNFLIEDTDFGHEFYTDHSFETILLMIECNTGSVLRNQFFTHNDGPDYGMAHFGVQAVFVTDLVFMNNAIYGSFTEAAFLDLECSALVFNHNTINNYCPDDAYNGAHGYRANRSFPNPVSSFRNNLIIVTTYGGIQSFPLFIDGSFGNWIPLLNPSMCNYNNYYDMTGTEVVCWLGVAHFLMDWQLGSGMDLNSYDLDPNLRGPLRVNKVTVPYTPNEILTGGVYLGSTVLDIDNGKRNPVAVCIGCDQLGELVMNVPTGGTFDMGTATANTGVVTQYLTIIGYGHGNHQVAAFIEQTYGGLFVLQDPGDPNKDADYYDTPRFITSGGASYNIPIAFDTTGKVPGYYYYSAIIISHNDFINVNGCWGCDSIKIQILIQ